MKVTWKVYIYIYDIKNDIFLPQRKTGSESDPLKTTQICFQPNFMVMIFVFLVVQIGGKGKIEHSHPRQNSHL